VSETRPNRQVTAWCGDDDMIFNLTWHNWMNAQSLIEASEIIAKTAQRRENSHGTHSREDIFDQRDLATSCFNVARQMGDENEIERALVEFAIVKSGEFLFEDVSPVQHPQQS